MIFHSALFSGHRQTVAATVEMPIIAPGHAISFHQVNDLLTAITLVQRRVMEKAEFFPVASRF
jgi:hypothetical protein